METKGKRMYPAQWLDGHKIRCMACYAANADYHIFQEEEKGLYYSGISYHQECFDKLKRGEKVT